MCRIFISGAWSSPLGSFWAGDLNERTKTIPQKGASSRVQRWEQSLLTVYADGIEDDWRGYKSDAGQ